MSDLVNGLRRIAKECNLRACDAAADEIERNAELNNAKDAAIAELVGVLKEARRWIGDGEFSDGLHIDYWTPEYRVAVAMVDAAIKKAES